jgi:outer membrane receptor for ferrienterochelin and colicins
MRLTIPSALLLLTILAGDTAPARAQTPSADPPGGLAGKSLEDLLSVEVGTVFGAAKREQRLTEAPSSVTILTAEDIRTFGWTTMADALNGVRGFYTTNDRNYTYVGVRGFGRPSDYNNRILLLVNGHRYNDNVYDQASVGQDFPIDMALVDRIEVIRGPGSALYGTSAFFAVINVVVRPGGGFGGTEAAFEVGSHDTYKARATYGTRTATGVDALLSMSYTTSHGQELLYFPQYDDPSTGFGLSRGADGERATGLFASVGHGRFTLQGAFDSRRKYVPTGAWGTVLGDVATHTTDSRAWVDATVTGAFRGAALTARAFADYSGYRGSYLLDEEGGPADTRDTADGAWIGGEATASRRLGARHQVTTGVEYRRNLRQDQGNWYIDPYLVTVDARYKSNQFAIYGQDEIHLHRRLTATVGGRYDWWSLTGGTATPRAGLVYRTDADTAFKALYGEAYRAPTVYETYYYPDPLGRTLQPERLRTTEIVYEQYLGGSLRLTATGYVTLARNLISQIELDPFYFENRERTRSRGIELEAERRWSNGVLARASFVVQRSNDRLGGGELSNSPRELGLVHVAVPAWSRSLSLATESQYVGARLSTLGTSIPGGWLTHVNLTYRPAGRPITVAGHVGNLFDRAYGHPVGLEFRQDVIPQDGRSVSLRATLRF